MSIGNKYVIHQTVPSSSIDGKCRATVLSLLGMAQDLASSHYGTGGISIPHLQKKGLTWVITKQRFEISEYPLWLDAYRASTWAKTPRGPFFFRDFCYSYEDGGRFDTIDAAFEAQSASGNEVQGSQPVAAISADGSERIFVRGASLWMVLDMTTGKPVKAGPDVMGTLSFCDDDALENDFSKIHEPETWDYEYEFAPTVLDIDLNNHVNNLAYVKWILSYLPEAVYAGKLVKAIETNYVAQAMFNDTLCCRAATAEDGSCIHSIVRVSDGAEMFRARTEWRPETEMSRTLETR